MTLNQITIYYSKALHSSYTHLYNRIDFQVDVTKVMKILEVDCDRARRNLYFLMYEYCSPTAVIRRES